MLLVFKESSEVILDKSDLLEQLNSLASTFLQRLKDVSKLGIKCNNTDSYIEILVTINEISDVRTSTLRDLLNYILEFSRYLQGLGNLKLKYINYYEPAVTKAFLFITIILSI